MTNDLAFKATFVPEPGTWVLLGVGLAMLACAGRYRMEIGRRQSC